MLSSSISSEGPPFPNFDQDSDQSTLHKHKHRAAHDNCKAKMEKATIQGDWIDEVLWGIKTKNGHSVHATNMLEATPSGGDGEEADLNKFFEVSFALLSILHHILCDVI